MHQKSSPLAGKRKKPTDEHDDNKCESIHIAAIILCSENNPILLLIVEV